MRFKRNPHFALNFLGIWVFRLFLVSGSSIKTFKKNEVDIFVPFPGLWSCRFKGNVINIGKVGSSPHSSCQCKAGCYFPYCFPRTPSFLYMDELLLAQNPNVFASGAAFPARSFNAALFLSTCKAAFAHTCCVVGSFSPRRAQHLFCFLNGERERHSQEILLLSCLLTTKEI